MHIIYTQTLSFVVFGNNIVMQYTYSYTQYTLIVIYIFTEFVINTRYCYYLKAREPPANLMRGRD